MIEDTSLINSCVENIIQIIEVGKRKIENRELLKLCENLGSCLEGNIDAHVFHEIAEVALNTLIKRKYARELLSKQNQIEAIKEILEPITERFPTQTWRSNRQSSFQQFSTPPKIAYLLTYFLNLKAGEQVLEPSAGTGSLAVWASGFGNEVHTNELDPSRNNFLTMLGFKPKSFNAEFINDYLPEDVLADCVLMNPPFSASGGRTKNNSSKFGFRHVCSALERLEPGGKFGIILGEAAELRTKTGNEFWQKMSGKISVKAIIKIAGREYYKNGTSVDVNVIVGTKRFEEQNIDWRAERNLVVSVAAKSVEEAFNLAEKLNLRLE